MSDLHLIGTEQDDILVGAEGNDWLEGLAGNDTLIGGWGNDILDGGVGQDSMLGGAGDDFYIVDDAADWIVENADEGVDTVRSFANFYQLVDHIENLTLAGAAASGIGNDSANIITGNEGDNVIAGRGGDDSLIGGEGNDYVVDFGDGNDLLNGGLGSDFLIGEGGDDVYLPGFGGQDTIHDSGGDDEVRLPAGIAPEQVERLHFEGSSDLVLRVVGTGEQVRLFNWFVDPMFQIERVVFDGGTVWAPAETESLRWLGTASSETLFGTSYDETFEGRGGNDFFQGGLGNDVYVLGDLGFDGVFDAGGDDEIHLPAGVTPDQVERLRGEGSNTLILRVQGTGEQLMLVDWFVDPMFQIERVVFDGGTVWAPAETESLRWLGTEQGDFLQGTSWSERLEGRGGSDSIMANAGDDVLDGGAGAGDFLLGGEGDDVLSGGAGGYALMDGGDGSDTYRFSSGDGYANAAAFTLGDKLQLTDLNPGDVIITRGEYNVFAYVPSTGATINLYSAAGVPGQEAYRATIEFSDGTVWGPEQLAGVPYNGTEGNDVLNGSEFDDELYGLGGNDDLYGNDGNDYLDGDDGMDRLYGGAGDDFFVDSAGFDQLYGGAGNDTYLITDFDLVQENAGEGTDVISTNLNYVLPDHVEYLIMAGSQLSGTGNDLNNVLVGNASDNILIGNGGNDILTGLGGNDFLDGGFGVDSMHGGAGDDYYVVDDEGDWIVENAGEGVDTVESSITSYTLASTLENLTLVAAASTGIGNDSANIVTGNDAGNFISGRGGDDILIGGGGNDDLVDFGDGNDLLDGGSGSDFLIGVDGDDVYLPGFGGQDMVQDSSGNDELRMGVGTTPDQVERFRVEGHLVLRIAGTTEQVTLLNWFFDPTYQIEGVVFDDGTVWMPAETESLRFFGTAGDDVLHGTEWGERIEGRGGHDLIFGNDGDDVLVGGEGSDFLVGGAGADTYVFSAADGAGNSASIGAGDRVQLEGLSRSSVLMTRDEFSLYITVMDTGATLTLQSASGLPGEEGWRTTLEFGDGSVWLPENIVNTSPYIGSVFNDILNGSEFGDQIFADWGNDTVHGNDGNDVLYGGLGFDSLMGGQGNDVLDGGSGDDVLQGGAGNDTYVFARGTGFDAAWELLGTAADFDVVAVAADIAPSEITVQYIPPNGVFVPPFNEGGFILIISGTGDAFVLIGSPTTGPQIEQVIFADGTIWDETILVAMAIENGFPPIVVNPLADQGASEDAPFAYVVPADAFFNQEDPIGDSLSYSASLVDGSALPSWLAFDAITRAFSGTPANGDVGTIAVRVTATDETGRTGSDVFDLAVANINDAPERATAIADQVAQDTIAFSFAVPSATFTDVDAGDTLTYSATLAGGGALPGWLSFDPGAQMFSGTPGVADIGAILYIEVDATDSGGLSASDEFTITVGAAPDQTITGTSNNDTLSGASGNDTINGLAGADSMSGGLGNDTYFVDNSGDQVIESAGAGIDLVSSSVSHTLGANVENLILTGSANRTGTGNGLDNVITGNSGSNTLNGGAGDDYLDGGTGTDSLVGGTGNDTFVVNSSNDSVNEQSGAGTDAVRSSIGYTLGSNVENLVLFGISAINGTGNTLNNAITGNSASNTLNGSSGNDTLDGGAGADTLTGGNGNDVLVYDAPDLRVDGGGGQDALRFAGSGEALDLTGIPSSRYTGIEIIDLTGTGNNALTLNLTDVLDLSSSTNTLRLDGNADDTANSGGQGWVLNGGGPITIGLNQYNSYGSGAATLLIDTDITQNIS